MEPTWMEWLRVGVGLGWREWMELPDGRSILNNQMESSKYNGTNLNGMVKSGCGPRLEGVAVVGSRASSASNKPTPTPSPVPYFANLTTYLPACPTYLPDWTPTKHYPEKST